MSTQQDWNPSLRHVHLDFHTPDFVKVGEQFNAVQFFDTLQAAEVNSIALFALCHHGNSYFNTRTGHRHPGLDFDLFGAMAEEAAKRDFPIMPYFSMNVNERIARQHPDWAALWADGTPVNSQILQDGTELFWTWLCPNRGPLIEDFFFPHIAEVLENYPSVDGVFVDMAGYLPGSCFCPACLEKMHAQGVDPHDPAQHAAFTDATIQQIARDLRALMDAKKPGLRLEMGGFNAFGEAGKAQGVISNFYLESLAFQTGWQYFELAARYFRKYGLPTMGMTGRFLKNWGDFGTIASPRQLKTQFAMHLLAGVGSSIGDHLPAQGVLEEGVYQAIGEAFRFIKPRQPYCVGMTPTKEAAVLVPEGVGANAATMNATGEYSTLQDAYKGVSKMLTELHYQYDLISASESLDGYASLFVTHGFFDLDFVAKVDAFVKNGGTLIASAHGLSAMDPEVRAAWQALIGVQTFAYSAHQGEFYKVTDGRLQRADHPNMYHYVHAGAVDATFAADVEALAEDWRSPCVRAREHHYGHFHGPATVQDGTAVGVRRVGQGTVILLRPQLFPAYLHTGYFVHRLLLRDLLEAFLPADRRQLRTNAPSLVEVALGEKEGRVILQAMPFITERRDRNSFESISDDPIAIRGVWVDLPHVTGTTAQDPIIGIPVPIERQASGIRLHLPDFHEHLLITIE